MHALEETGIHTSACTYICLVPQFPSIIQIPGTAAARTSFRVCKLYQRELLSERKYVEYDALPRSDHFQSSASPVRYNLVQNIARRSPSLIYSGTTRNSSASSMSWRSPRHWDSFGWSPARTILHERPGTRACGHCNRDQSRNICEKNIIGSNLSRRPHLLLDSSPALATIARKARGL